MFGKMGEEPSYHGIEYEPWRAIKTHASADCLAKMTGEESPGELHTKSWNTYVDESSSKWGLYDQS